MSSQSGKIEKAYALACEEYGSLGVEVGAALERLTRIPLSIHCWQGDDVQGFEASRHALGGGLAVTGTYPGRARTLEELRTDFEKALTMLPGSYRFNLHASYADTGGKPVERDQLEPSHFESWIQWARDHDLGLDFNPTYFAHPLTEDGFTLSHPDPKIRRFWIDHGIVCRRIGAEMGKALGSACITNFWIPDGMKDFPIDRLAPRHRLQESLDAIFEEAVDPSHGIDAVEGKLFGLGSESYVVGSHEFYYGYAIRNNKLLCLDSGHYHPTESIADKLSAVLLHLDSILLHVSRGVRWDSDHVVVWNDELENIATELVRADLLDRVHIGLDYFDASINRVAAWVIGTLALRKALLAALLEPTNLLREFERNGDYTRRLGLLEDIKTLPFGAVWNYYCDREGVPPFLDWSQSILIYERDVLFKRF